MATNWSKLAKQFLDKMKPKDPGASDSPESGAQPSQPAPEKAAETPQSAPTPKAEPPKPAPPTPAAKPPAPKPAQPVSKASSKEKSKSSEAVTAPAMQTGTIDIARQQIGGVYAKALLGAAGSKSSDVVQELGGLAQVVRDVPAFGDILNSPRVSTEEKIGLLDRTLKRRVSPVVLNFLKVVSEHGRLDCLQYIYIEARRLHNESSGITQVIVTTAETLSSGDLKKVKADLESKLGAKVDIETRVDASIIGGIVIRMGDNVYDGSVAQKLTSMRETAVAKSVEKMRAATGDFALD